ncbi:hypothetical protein KX928_17420 [Roseobacter sp. YSTF-M11]|uniref:NlpC/P60 domain-containing protein n=1 Tax=Roseobacter insulae TaxID=2859783 RepID=A0A9X1FXF6_9RHOB|nr:hypothetical protein [Roseobacter insulae]MBW4709569.1 hypothetical protein [Roseobacter insulae]
MIAAVNPAVIAVHAAAWIGTPWHRRAAVRGVGADCVGLIRGILAETSGVMVTPPPFVEDWAEADTSPILAAGNRHLVPGYLLDAPAAGDVVAFRIGGGPVAHVGVLVARDDLIETGPARVVHVCERRGTVESRAPWHLAGRWRFPLAEGCETGKPNLKSSDLLAIVQEDAEGAFYTVQDMMDGTPLSRSRHYPTPGAALDAIPPAIAHVERV